MFMHNALIALSEPNRMAIMGLLRDGERPAGDFVAALPISQPAVSKHLGVLRAAGLVTVRKDANRRLYRLNPAPLAELDAWLAPYRRFWTDKLDALEAHLDKEFPQ
jgi:DNA-binding transcriptional ArsR family regulator